METSNQTPYYDSAWGSFILSVNDMPDDAGNDNINISGSWLQPMFYENDYLAEPVKPVADGVEQPDNMDWPKIIPAETQRQELPDEPAGKKTCKPCRAVLHESASPAIAEYKPPYELYTYQRPQAAPGNSQKAQAAHDDSQKAQAGPGDNQKPQAAPVDSQKAQAPPVDSQKVQAPPIDSQKAQAPPIDNQKPQVASIDNQKPQAASIDNQKPQAALHNSSIFAPSWQYAETAPRAPEKTDMYQYNQYANYQPYPVIMDYTAPAAPQNNQQTFGRNDWMGGYTGSCGQNPAVPQNNAAVAPNCDGINIPNSVFYLLLLRLIYLYCYSY